MKRHIASILAVFCFRLLLESFSTPQVLAQDTPRPREAGLPVLQNFRPKNYQALSQNWAIAQDRVGVMYFGNNAGVLEYDGSTWRTIALPGLSAVHALARDEHGQIFVGGNNELGYLAPDAVGRLHYVSLLEHLPATERNFGRATRIAATPEGVFFEADQELLRLRRAFDDTTASAKWRSKIWKLNASSFRLHFAQNQILVSVPEKLLALRQDSLHVILHHAEATNAAINLMLPYPEESAAPAPQNTRMLMGTRSEGLFLYDGVSLSPFHSEANAYLRENNLYHGAALPNGRYAFATLWGGAVIIDRQGRLLQIINKAAGLHNENILSVFADRESGLWLATDGGLARIETSTPLLFFQEAQGLTGQVNRIVRHRNRLYVGTSSGLAYLAAAAAPGFAPVIKFVPEMKAQTLALLSDGGSLLVGGSEGIYRLDENDRSTRLDENGAEIFLRAKKDPQRIYAGLEKGLAVLSSVAGLLKIPGITGDVRFIAEDSSGALWAAEGPQGIFYVQLPRGELTPATIANTKIEYFDSANGLPEGWVIPYAVHDRIIIATPKGLRRFDPATRAFPPDSSFGAFFADTNRTFQCLAEDFQKQVWMDHGYQGRNETGVAVPGKDADSGVGAYQWVTALFSRISEVGAASVFYADPDQPGVMWFGCEETLVRYDPASPSRESGMDFSALVRRVTMKGDSVIYGGAEAQLETVIAYADNALRFEYAAPTFDNSAATRYQYYLEGFEESWSAWTAETKKEYTNLHEGAYRFHVRAKNVYERVSDEDVFDFKILPPWYRTWWAYGIYALFAGAGVFGLVRWRVQALHQRARQLEATVAERTAQVVEQKNRLEEQSHQLQEMDRVKSRFFANISHEFRTPLTLILGPLERVLHGAEKHNSFEDTRMMHRNATSLLRLVNQLLDLVKLESGRMRLQASVGDLIDCVRTCLAAFDSLSKSKKIALHFHAPAPPLLAWFNRNQLEEVFYNLLSNALKFTPEGGEVSVRVAEGEEQRAKSMELGAKSSTLYAPSPMPSAVVSVKDTGLGIPVDKLPHVFDRFYQAESASTRNAGGTGIGLALVKELVELHYGQVEIKSEEGRGTELTVRLPLGCAHLKAEEVVGEQLPVISEREVKIEDRGLKIVDEATSNQRPATNDEDTIILIVEDNADMRAYIRRELEGDYKVVAAQNGEEGLKTALEIIPDLIISDVMMPVMDGLTLCARLKTDEKTSHIPVILLTAKAEREDKLEGLQTGADDYLTKPFDTVELQARVKNLIALRRKLQEKFKKQMLLRPSEISVVSADEVFLQKVVATVEAHLEDESFSPEDLALAVGMSRAQFYRKLRALTGQPAGHFIRAIRLERAADLLKQGAGTITEIAYKVGFSSQPYFSKCFQEQFGMTPREYREKQQEG